jgi:DNA-binding PadR family transcriptional regulator
MDILTLKVLGMFEHWDKEVLDLHELFEAGGNDPDERKAVFYAVERLVEDGLLEERGNDFYALTAEGKRVARETVESGGEEGE